jgi:hypothetical protein
MNVFKPAKEMCDGNGVYCRFMLESNDDRRVLDDFGKFNGTPIPVAEWKPWKIIRAYTTPGNLTKPLGDRAGIDFKSDPMVLSRRALNVLLPHIGSFGQALPLGFDDAEYFLFNVTNIVDALDEAACEVWRFPSSGRIGQIIHYSFRPDAVRDQLMFKIPQQPKGFAFVTDRFVELVERAGLTGFAFERLWSDAAPSEAKAA